MTIVLPGSKITSLQSIHHFVNILVFAYSGTGKTVLCGSDDGVLFIAPEDSGTISALRLGSNAQKWPITRWQDLMEVNSFFWDMQERGEEIPFKWFAVDSLTEMQDMAMAYVLEQDAERKKSKGEDPDVPQIQDWLKYYIIFENMVRSFNDLNVNVIYTALVQTLKDANYNEFLAPDIRGKKGNLALKIVSLMTSFGYMETGVREIPVDPKVPNGDKRKIRERVITWQDQGTVKAKDRTLALIPRTVNLSLKQIREKIDGYQGPKIKADVAPEVKSIEASSDSKPTPKAATKPAPKATTKVEEKIEEKKEEATENNVIDVSVEA